MKIYRVRDLVTGEDDPRRFGNFDAAYNYAYDLCETVRHAVDVHEEGAKYAEPGSKLVWEHRLGAMPICFSV